MDSHRHLNISNGSFRPHVGYHFPPGDHNGTGRGLPGLNQTILNLESFYGLEHVLLGEELAIVVLKKCPSKKKS